MTLERDRMLDVAGRLRDAEVPGIRPGAFEISVGSTPSMACFENREQDGFSITEIRPGTYVYYDAMQVALGTATLQDCALTVLTTVISWCIDLDEPANPVNLTNTFDIHELNPVWSSDDKQMVIGGIIVLELDYDSNLNIKCPTGILNQTVIAESGKKIIKVRNPDWRR